MDFQFSIEGDINKTAFRKPRTIESHGFTPMVLGKRLLKSFKEKGGK
jgi:hypothetical protein